MATRTIKVNVCDRCGQEHDMADYMSGNSWGQLNVTWQGDQGGRSYTGDAGGINLKGAAWLCEQCTKAFLEFFKPQPKATADTSACPHGYPQTVRCSRCGE